MSVSNFLHQSLLSLKRGDIMKILGTISIVFALLLYTSAPKADLLLPDIDPPNVVAGSPWAGDDTNPDDLFSSNPVAEEWWLEALLGYSYDDPAISYIDKQDPSGLDGLTSWGTYDPSAWTENPITVPWDYAVVKTGTGSGFSHYAFYDNELDDLLTLPTDIILSNGVSHISYFVDPGLNPIPEPATMLLIGTGLAGIAGARLRKKKK